MRRADEALEAKALLAFEGAEPVAMSGGLSFRARPLAEEPFEIAVRVLELALGRAGLAPDNSRLQRREACAERLRRAALEGAALRLTLAGALVQLDRSGKVSIRPEPARRRGR
jgi:tRNA(Ile)-lysidine synthase